MNLIIVQSELCICLAICKSVQIQPRVMLNLQPSWVDKLNHNVTLRRPNFTPNRSSHLVAKELVVILASQPTYCWSGNLKLMTYSSLCTLTDRNFYQPMYGANFVLCYIGNDYMKCKSSTCTGWSGDWKQYMSEYSSWFQAQSNEDISAYSLCWMMNNMSAGQIFKGSTTQEDLNWKCWTIRQGRVIRVLLMVR